MINGKKVGLCLGSGGARGLAHVGVLQVLEENGIVPDIISGCSAGAIFGAIYAAGTNLYLLEKYLGTVDAKTIVDLGIPIQGGFLSGAKIEEVVLTLTHDLSFGETRIPFVCIATDLVSGEMKVFEEGKLHQAVRASMAVPGVFTPALIDGHYYVDGGVIEELPVDVLRARGVDVVITSDLGIKRNFFDPEHPSPVDILRRSSSLASKRTRGTWSSAPTPPSWGCSKSTAMRRASLPGGRKPSKPCPASGNCWGWIYLPKHKKDLPLGGQGAKDLM